MTIKYHCISDEQQCSFDEGLGDQVYREEEWMHRLGYYIQQRIMTKKNEL